MIWGFIWRLGVVLLISLAIYLALVLLFEYTETAFAVVLASLWYLLTSI